MVYVHGNLSPLIGAQDLEYSNLHDTEPDSKPNKREEVIIATKAEKGLLLSGATVAWVVHALQAIWIGAKANDHVVQLYVYYSGWVPSNPGYGCFETMPDGTKNVCVITQTRTEASKISLKAITLALTHPFTLGAARVTLVCLEDVARKPCMHALFIVCLGWNTTSHTQPPVAQPATTTPTSNSFGASSTCLVCFRVPRRAR
jgi:hypothetical protein